MDTNKARELFEAMHHGRNLTKHHLRQTYTNQNIAALWNQHLKTIALMERLQRLAEGPTPLQAPPIARLYWGGHQWWAEREGSIAIALGKTGLCAEDGGGYKEAYALAKRLFYDCAFKIRTPPHHGSKGVACECCKEFAISEFLRSQGQ